MNPNDEPPVALTPQEQEMETRLREIPWKSIPAEALRVNFATLRKAPKPQATTDWSHRVWKAFVASKWAAAIILLVGTGIAATMQQNRQGASAMDQAKERLVRLGGTLDIPSQLPETVPAELNFFALPVIQKWQRPSDPSNLRAVPVRYGVECEHYFPPEYIIQNEELTSWDVIDTLTDQALARGLKLSPELPRAQALVAKCREGSSDLDEMIAGLNRPYVQLIPSVRETWPAFQEDPRKMLFPAVGQINHFIRKVRVLAVLEAESGNTQRSLDLLKVMDRIPILFDDSFLGLMGSLVQLATDRMMLDCLPLLLSCEGWTATQLTELEAMVLSRDSLASLRKALLMEASFSHFFSQAKLEDRDLIVDSLHSSFNQQSEPAKALVTKWVVNLSPDGWIESNGAKLLNNHLDLVECATPEQWRQASELTGELKRRTVEWQFSPTGILASIGTPMLGLTHESAARNLFKKRAAALACALAKHKLENHTYPDSLESLTLQGPPDRLNDPASTEAHIRYRREGETYLLWAMGPDGIDDNGDEAKDWVWKILGREQ